MQFIFLFGRAFKIDQDFEIEVRAPPAPPRPPPCYLAAP